MIYQQRLLLLGLAAAVLLTFGLMSSAVVLHPVEPVGTLPLTPPPTVASTNPPVVSAPAPPPDCDSVPPPHPLFAGSVCILVRTYHLHKGRDDGGPSYSLARLLASLKLLEYRHWVALVYDTERSFTALPHIVASMNDDRIRHLKLTNEELDTLGPFNFHGNAGYHTTDFAINRCPAEARWFVPTNGDNYYFPSFLNHLNQRYDIIATDFLSRHLWSRTADDPRTSLSECSPVLRASTSDHCIPHTTPFYRPCMRNSLQLTKTEMSANIVNLLRWRRDNMSFMGFIKNRMDTPKNGDGNCGAPCGDGYAIEDLVTRKWPHRVRHECLMSHEPNAWSCCGEMKGIWRFGRCLEG